MAHLRTTMSHLCWACLRYHPAAPIPHLCSQTIITRIPALIPRHAVIIESDFTIRHSSNFDVPRSVVKNAGYVVTMFG